MLTLNKDTKKTLLYISIAFTFSVLMRLIWVYQFSGVEAFKFNNQFMINTNDGYYYAEGARDLLSGISQDNDLSPITSAGSLLTAFFAKILPFSFESVIFYLPVFLSSLVVIPIILIAKGLKNLEMGFIAALLASITWSYYNRTMAGYYDTDMLNIVLPMFLLWSIIWAINTNENKYLIITAIDILIYRWWYPQSYSLEFSFFGLILLYALIFDRKNMFNYKLLAIMMLAMMNIDGFIRLPLVLGAFYIFTQEKFDKYIYYILGASVLGFFVSGGFDPIWSKLELYVFKDAISVGKEGLNLHFFTVMQTIREAGQIPFETFANRISGHAATFIISIVGYAYLVYRHKIMIFALPMVGLGFLASVGGLRFTIYAVPILAFGIAFLITEISLKMPTNKMKVLSMVAFTLAILYPNYKHIDAYKVPTVFTNDEVKVLDVLKTKVDREDYVVSWWDYGYPIRYYADMKTLGDGGKHSGSVNFPLSYMLTSSQVEAAKMARLDVEYTEQKFKYLKENKEEIEDKNITIFSNIEDMTKDYGFNDTNDFLFSLQTEMTLPKKTRDIYFYLPFRMLNILPTVTLFSNMDLMTGTKGKQPFFFVSKNFKDSGSKIDLGRSIYIDKATSSIVIGQQKIPMKRFVKTTYNAQKKLDVNVQLINPTSDISVIYMANYNTFLVLDEKMYNSLYIQLMVLENYNKNLFEAVTLDPNVKVYKLKI
ncbi:STT3 domain-containing protein [Sulfurimonas sp.]|uniref:STT3 domain-containing protein n=1 Tax=Sulfurimonas sp. TaxID=2022749 RepID=UPI0025EF554C|nr:STT3 domain-containing protein [Sulfurimonas sp.]MBT5935149.1 peptide transporter [Sulfurimonas sp.]